MRCFVQAKKSYHLKKRNDDKMQQHPQQQIKVELGDTEAEGIYSNMCMIMHSPTEIVLDYARVMPRSQKARVLARIIMTPMHAKMMLQTLDDNLKKFEKQFGEIKIHRGKEKSSNPIGFESDHSGNNEENK
ncbi:MAG: DUF3467 domain-containing protein [candidate division Zixibacteria bacterium]|nr:DUF3467 domain-containing protein [candidate division Zixibacteria bacterium]MDH3937714.1 DUF3467 domain-containing protein [candidate division Zixibacteria bacterium]MDH4034508.1 DUF3467 domain-containing protein [candidate division Zixibacteria bacterium]